MKKYFSIGETARINQVPIKTLRYYDEVGLLTPAHTNGHTGYRYYSPEQFYLIDIIKYGKRLELSLDEIKNMMVDQELGGLVRMLAEQKRHAQEKIAALSTMIGNIDTTLENIGYVQSYDEKKAPYTRTKPASSIVFVLESEPSDMGVADVMLKKVMSDKRLQPYLTYNYGYFVSVDGLRHGTIQLHGEYITLSGSPDFDSPHLMHIPETACACFQYSLFDPGVDLKKIAASMRGRKCENKYILADEIFYSPVWTENVYELCIPIGSEIVE